MSGRCCGKYSTVSKIFELLKANKLAPLKSLSQNFLIDNNILDKIISSADISKSDLVIEIGPGLGALTERLAAKAGKVVAIEIDNKLAALLSAQYPDPGKVEILHADVLKTDFEKIIRSNAKKSVTKIKIAANLPYSLTTPILVKILALRGSLDSAVIMVQREFAKRMTAAPGSRDCSSLSVLVQFSAKAEITAVVSENSFYPKPNVKSALVRLAMLTTPPVNVFDENLFFAVVRAAFNQRRKMVKNTLVHGLEMEKTAVDSALLKAGVSGTRRGETLSMPEFALLSNAFFNVREVEKITQK